MLRVSGLESQQNQTRISIPRKKVPFPNGKRCLGTRLRTGKRTTNTLFMGIEGSLFHFFPEYDL
jgi:hypothetical protein